MPRKIIIDCDPGHDDAMAILLAHGSPEIELCAITTVAGNQTLEKTTLNARRICSAASITGVPVAAGCDRPLLRPLVTAPETHGESGLDGPRFDDPTTPLAGIHAVDLITDLVMGSPGKITLVPIGPLTNIAIAVRKEPRLATAVREVVLMGGAQTRGNSTPAAEFNIFVDPEAAAIVFQAGWPLTMIGLDLTHQAQATPEVIERISALGTPLAAIVVELMNFFKSTYQKTSGFDSPPVHDPCAIARIIDPKLVDCVATYVTVETHGTTTSGMTSVDFDNRFGNQPNALVATKLDFDGFWNLMLDAIRRIGGLQDAAESARAFCPPAIDKARSSYEPEPTRGLACTGRGDRACTTIGGAWSRGRCVLAGAATGPRTQHPLLGGCNAGRHPVLSCGLWTQRLGLAAP